MLTVVAAWHLTPNMIRVTLTAPEIAAMNPDCHGANCKLFLPGMDQNRQAFAAQLAEGPRPAVRTYTIRQMRQNACEMDIDFVDHGDAGPASAWARRAAPGAFCGFAGPGPVKVKSFYADDYLVIADMSAIPVAAATLEAMPDDAIGTAIFQINHADDKQNFRIPEGMVCHWITTPDPQIAQDHIMDLVTSMASTDSCTQTCIAGESSLIKALRHELLITRAMPKEDCYISGYWKVGTIEDDHQKMKRAEAAAG
ncbi:siderophore-interacting protein [Loktanella agnita]